MTKNKPLSKALAADEAARCLLCHNAPCAKACKTNKDPDRILRSLRFDNLDGAAARASECLQLCANCAGRECESACILKKNGEPVKIAGAISYLESYAEKSGITGAAPARDLSIDFCGIRCENPFFLSSSIVASNFEMCAQALEMGWGGIVFKTIAMFVPKELSPRFDTLRKERTEFIGFKNLEQISDRSLEENLSSLRRLKEDYPQKVIVASIMGQTEEEWTELARLAEQEGHADIIECNFSCPHMTMNTVGSDVGQNPELVQQYTAAARRGTSLPILAKMTPNIGNMEIPAIAAKYGGADGLAAINTIKSILNIDLDACTPAPSIAGKSSVSGYSGKAVKPIALRFIHDIARHPELSGMPISGMGGIETWRDALEFILLGCSNLQVTTAVMQYGYRIIDDLKEGLSIFMEQRGIDRLSSLVGQALPNIVPADQLDRDTMVYPVTLKDLCQGCGRCHIACRDAGHQAIEWDGRLRAPRLAGHKCVGCLLCMHVCPAGAIRQGKRVPLRLHQVKEIAKEKAI